MDDAAAWLKYPHHRRWFNKLDLSLRLGYDCGPGGVAPSKTGYYVVRPIYNLSGMGVGARRVRIAAGDCTKVEPGYFWCEWFDGPHISTNFKYTDGRWVAVSSWRGVNDPENLSRFLVWEQVAPQPSELTLDGCDKLNDVDVVNVEYVGLHPIEVHLRPSPDPKVQMFVPVWADEQIPDDGFVTDYDDANGFLDTPRLGFKIVS